MSFSEGGVDLLGGGGPRGDGLYLLGDVGEEGDEGEGGSKWGREGLGGGADSAAELSGSRSQHDSVRLVFSDQHGES